MISYGFAVVPIISVRLEPDHYSQLTTQMLFGDLYKVLEQHENWYYIEAFFDGYRGWIQTSQHTAISEEHYLELSQKKVSYTAFPLQPVTVLGKNYSLYVSMGSIVYDTETYQIGRYTFKISSEALFVPESDIATSIVNLARRCLHMPYLWGGKSILGFDCSGLVQVIYRMHHIFLPRNAYQQATVGKEIPSLSAAQKGDLAFFGRKQVSHVGIITGEGTIIHCSGLVAEDILDEQGIRKMSTNQYTHPLHSIRRIL